MDDVTRQALFGQLRHVVGIFGGGLIARGLLSADTAAWMNEVFGAVLALAMMAWSAYDKKRAEQKAKAREVIAVNVGIEVSNQEAGTTAPLPAVIVPDVIKEFAQSPAGPAPIVERKGVAL